MLQTVGMQANSTEDVEGLKAAHEQIMRKGATALEDGEIDGYLDLYVDNPVFHVLGPMEVSGDFHGKDALRELYSKIQKLVGGDNFTTIAHDTLFTGAHGIWLILFYPDGDRFHEKHYTMYAVNHFYHGRISETWFVFWPKKVTISPLPPSGHDLRGGNVASFSHD
ncbi:nuclear transport factor 2-like protein [Rhizobium laguerreae]|uniref:nuclear transport factor 2 family protein n=1 Tax=Rhizobium laguerreae TaxID=1076926 RepID=UPI001C9274FA|nr:nuclear transport factor 2 family protein [Rhizobium laguerreae]MBY3557350.1 hypothetical protein [Rhizobium laguerreae]